MIKINRFVYAVLGVFLLLTVQICFAEEEPNGVSDTIGKMLTLQDSIGEAIKQEQEHVAGLELKTSRKETLRRFLDQEVATYKIQYSTYANLLLIQEIPVKNIESARSENDISLSQISQRIGEQKALLAETLNLLAQTNEQIVINTSQLTELPKVSRGHSELKALPGKFQVLLGHLSRKKALLEELQAFYSKAIEGYETVEADLKSLRKKLDQAIVQKKRSTIFTKTNWEFLNAADAALKSYQELVASFSGIASRQFWDNEIRLFQTIGLPPVLLFFGLGLLIEMLLFRKKAVFQTVLDLEAVSQSVWCTRFVTMIRKTNLLLAATLYVFIFSQFGTILTKSSTVLLLFYLMVVWLFARWFLLFFSQLLEAQQTDDACLKLHRWLRLLVCCVAGGSAAALITLWTGYDNGFFFFTARLVSALLLYGWLFKFWRLLEGCRDTAGKPASKRLANSLGICRMMGYGIVLTGIIMDLMGFVYFSAFWYLAWAKSSAVLLWTVLLFFSIRELSGIQDMEEKKKLEEEQGAKLQVKWLVSRLLLLFGLLVSLPAMILVWGGKDALVRIVMPMILTPVTIGTVKLSALTLLIALVIILITQTLAGTVRQVFLPSILNRSGIEKGVQDSIATLTFYGIWVLGLLLSLTTLGFSMNTLTIIFGALGIGLGFGLQNIFNNFISGLILLFERPIQVGDDIEIDGIWAMVKKINVRSTVVQTYDNATIIIPNSEFISAKVTNWSFKDPRVRRKVEVGVAYGSDLELVKKSLLEAADTTGRLLKTPKPDVIFTSFGDNALIFVLRFWTKVNCFLEVETQVRLTIDRLFRERSIEISFPQRDLHIKSVPANESANLNIGIDDRRKLEPQPDSKPELQPELQPKLKKDNGSMA